MSNPLEYPELKSQKSVKIKHPEGLMKECLVFKSTQRMPDGLPYFCLELFSEDSCSLEDVFLDRSEDFHDGQASLTHQHVLSASLEERVVRLTGVPQLLTWGEFEDKVGKAQTAMKEKEAEVLRQMDLAQTGQAAETSVEVLQSGSRFRRRSEGPAAAMEQSVGPQAARTAGRGGRGGRGGCGGRGGRGGAGSGGRRVAGKAAAAPPGAVVAVASSASDYGGGRSVVASTFLTPVKTKPSGSSASLGGGPEGSPVTAVGTVCSFADTRDEKLKLLLTSNHGKLFPSIMEILRGTKIKRELNGDSISAALRASELASDVVLGLGGPGPSKSQNVGQTSAATSAFAVCSSLARHQVTIISVLADRHMLGR